jgi:hypothetical protein
MKRYQLKLFRYYSKKLKESQKNGERLRAEVAELFQEPEEGIAHPGNVLKKMTNYFRRTGFLSWNGQFLPVQ